MRWESSEWTQIIEWKGNYLNLGAGFEAGFYYQNDFLSSVSSKMEHWVVGDTLPMTASLYKRENGKYTNYYHWLPTMEQWWITGFMPDTFGQGMTEDQLLQIASVDFRNIMMILLLQAC